MLRLYGRTPLATYDKDAWVGCPSNPLRYLKMAVLVTLDECALLMANDFDRHYGVILSDLLPQ